MSDQPADNSPSGDDDWVAEVLARAMLSEADTTPSSSPAGDLPPPPPPGPRLAHSGVTSRTELEGETHPGPTPDDWLRPPSEPAHAVERARPALLRQPAVATSWDPSADRTPSPDAPPGAGEEGPADGMDYEGSVDDTGNPWWDGPPSPAAPIRLTDKPEAPASTGTNRNFAPVAEGPPAGDAWSDLPWPDARAGVEAVAPVEPVEDLQDVAEDVQPVETLLEDVEDVEPVETLREDVEPVETLENVVEDRITVADPSAPILAPAQIGGGDGGSSGGDDHGGGGGGGGGEGEDDDAPATSLKKHTSARRALVEWIAVIAGALVVALVIKTFLIAAFYIPSASMEPTLQKYDRVLVNKLSYRLHDIRRGDVVVFEGPPEVTQNGVKDLIKRVVGLPGDTVEGRDGKVYVNGDELDESEYLEPEVVTPPFEATKVPEDHIFVMGDNRGNSEDSTYFGPIPQDTVVGRAFILIWPVSRIGFL